MKVLSWDDHQKEARSTGYELGIVLDADQEETVTKFLQTFTDVCNIGNSTMKSLIDPSTCHGIWIQGKRLKGLVFQWLNGEKVRYFDWHKFEPSNSGGNEDCIEIMKRDYKWAWNDNVCSKGKFALYTVAEPSSVPSTPPSTSAPTSGVAWNQLGESIVGAMFTMSFEGNTIAVVGPDRKVHIRNWLPESEKWSEPKSLEPPFKQLLGLAMSSNGKRIIIGDYTHNGNTGAVSVFRKRGRNSDWSRVGLILLGNKAGDNYGHSVAITDNGNRIAVGTGGGDYVKLFDKSRNNWVEHNKFNGTQYLSLSMSADGTKMVTGSQYSDLDKSDRGSVHFYNLTSCSIIQMIHGDAVGDSFGYSVSLSRDGSRAAVGTFLGGQYVKVLQYNTTENEYTQISGNIKSTDEVLFGRSVVLAGDGSRLAVGAPNSGIAYSGSTFIYTIHGESWDLISEIKGNTPLGFSGSTLAISNDGRQVAIRDEFSVDIFWSTGLKPSTPPSSAPSHLPTSSSTPALTSGVAWNQFGETDINEVEMQFSAHE